MGRRRLAHGGGGMTTVYTAGHGNRPIAEFIRLVQEAGVTALVDVRAFPASRRHPHFARAALEESLPAAGIRYVWEGQALGGRRKPAGNSPHVALRHPAFRAYADHMATELFREGLERLTGIARAAPAVIVCAERLPWQCHRFLISDYLVANGLEVVHLVNPGKRQAHRLNPVARLREGQLVYDGETQNELGL
jgi:uncharacterized protein (DUF488 family)